MKKSGIVLVAALLLPMGAQAQVEVGMDAGLMISGVFQDGGSVTNFAVPNGTFRIGTTGDGMGFDVFFNANIIRVEILGESETVSQLTAYPGVTFPIGDGALYVRPEAGLQIISGGGDTETDFGLGAAIGTKRQMGSSPFSWRFEAGFDRWLDSETNQLRATAGLAAVIG